MKLAKSKVEENEKNLKETKDKIKKLKKDPIKREDQELINSLKEKLKN